MAGGKVIAGESVLGSAGVADFFGSCAFVGTGTEPGSADLSVRLRLSSGSGGIGVALAVIASLGASLGVALAVDAGRAAGGVGSEAEPFFGFVGFRALSVPPAAPAEYPAAVVDASLVPALFAGSPGPATEETRRDDAGAFAGAFESPSRRRVGGGGSLDFGFASRRALLFSRAADFPSTLSKRSASASTPSALDSLRSEGEGGGGIFDFRRLARDLSRTDAAPYAATVSARSGVSRSTPECSSPARSAPLGGIFILRAACSASRDVFRSHASDSASSSSPMRRPSVSRASADADATRRASRGDKGAFSSADEPERASRGGDDERFVRPDATPNVRASSFSPTSSSAGLARSGLETSLSLSSRGLVTRGLSGIESRNEPDKPGGRRRFRGAEDRTAPTIPTPRTRNRPPR
jgi:hypothetical protein